MSLETEGWSTQSGRDALQAVRERDARHRVDCLHRVPEEERRVSEQDESAGTNNAKRVLPTLRRHALRRANANRGQRHARPKGTQCDRVFAPA